MKLGCSLELWTPILDGIEFQGPLWPYNKCMGAPLLGNTPTEMNTNQGGR
jgi:hypothetical protein